MKALCATFLAFFMLLSLASCRAEHAQKAPMTSQIFDIQTTDHASTVEENTASEQELRVVAYVPGQFVSDYSIDQFDTGHLDAVTDVILFHSMDVDVFWFDSTGEVHVSPYGLETMGNLKALIAGRDIRLHVFLRGPEPVWGGVDEEYQAAFQSGVLEANIKDLLDTYDLDGISFDWEHPDTAEDWRNFSDFLISLDKTLGDEYLIGSALAVGFAELSSEAVKVLDRVQLMSYDFWEPSGAHATLALAKSHVAQLLDKGYLPEQIDLGLPFYARPTDKSRVWYDYGDYYDKLDREGYYACPETGLTFSFNTEDVIYQKTVYAIESKLGGVMVWHYNSDAPSDSGHSLFSAIQKAKSDANVK